MARPKHPERCGRFTGHENDNTQAIEQLRQEADAITAKAKEFAAARRARSPVCMEQLPDICDKWEHYIEECEHSRQPLTWGGFALAAGISTRTIDRMRAGELDHIVEEYILIHDIEPTATEYINDDGQIIPLVPWSQICQKLEALIQDQLERNCYTNKGNPAGSIFGLKARFNWQDQQQSAGTINNNLVIADADQARKALEMLK